MVYFFGLEIYFSFSVVVEQEGMSAWGIIYNWNDIIEFIVVIYLITHWSLILLRQGSYKSTLKRKKIIFRFYKLVRNGLAAIRGSPSCIFLSII